MMNSSIKKTVYPLLVNMLGKEDIQSALTLKRKDTSGNENVDTSPEPRLESKQPLANRSDCL